MATPDIKSEFAKIPTLIANLLQLFYWYLEALYRLIIPPPMKSIDGETILVTGAVGGIGKEICKHIVRSGYNIKLILWDLDEVDLEKFASVLREMGGGGRGTKVYPFAVDISTRENIEKGCQKIKSMVGPVTIIFNNAAIAPRGNFLALTNEQIDKTFQINLMSHIWTIRQFLPGMVKRNHGRIVNVCSVLGLRPIHHVFPYVASKFAGNAYMESLRTELAMYHNDGIHVTTVYPYIVNTPLIGSFELKEDSNPVVPKSLLEFLDPEDVGRKAVDGVRREYEYIYLPRFAPFITLAEYFIPLKFKNAMYASFFDLVRYRIPEEQKMLTTPFSRHEGEPEIRGHGKSG